MLYLYHSNKCSFSTVVDFAATLCSLCKLLYILMYIDGCICIYGTWFNGTTSCTSLSLSAAAAAYILSVIHLCGIFLVNINASVYFGYSFINNLSSPCTYFHS